MTEKPTGMHHRFVADDDDFEEYAPVGLEGLLASTEKLLAINRGLAEPDERDALPNDRIYTPDRLVKERIKLDHGRTLRSLMGRLARTKSLSAMAPDSLSPYTVGYLDGNPLAPALEEINPMHITEQQRRITKMGPGGVGDPNAITTQMQSVHASQFGFVDPIAGPECFDDQSEVYTLRGWVAWPDVLDDDTFACLINGVVDWRKADRIVRQHYTGELIVAESKTIRMAVTPNHRVLFKREQHSSEFCVAEACAVYGECIQIPRRCVPRRSLPQAKRCLNHKGSVKVETWEKVAYDGTVYCATVPGGLLYVRGKRGTAGFWSGNSERAGVDIRLAWGVKIGSDGRLYQRMRNRAGKLEWVSPTQLVGKTLKLPD